MKNAIFVSLVLLPFTCGSVDAAILPGVIYSINYTGTINNPDGIWGGDLLPGSNNVNLTIEYTFLDRPIRFPSCPCGHTGPTNMRHFEVVRLRVVDNDNGLASDVITRGTSGALGFIGLTYSASPDSDFQGDAVFGSPGGAFFSKVRGEFGNLGDSLPRGTAFDTLMNAAAIDGVIARASSNAFFGNVDGANGPGILSPGDFTFSSEATTVVPLPASAALFGAAILSLAFLRRHFRHSWAGPDGPTDRVSS